MSGNIREYQIRAGGQRWKGLNTQPKVKERKIESALTFCVLRSAHYASHATFCSASLLSLYRQTDSVRKRTLDYVIAVVNDQPITLRELETELILIAVISNPLILRERENELSIQEIKNPPNTVKRAALETLIEQKLMLQQADDIGILLWSWGKKVSAEIQALKAAYSDETLFLVDLKRMGLEYQEVEERLRNALIVNELTVRQFRNSIDDEQIGQEAPQYFEKHRSDLLNPHTSNFSIF